MQRTSVHKEYKIAEDVELAIRSYLEYVCRLGGNYRMALGSIQKYVESAWDSAYNTAYGYGPTAVEDIVNSSDANQIRNNRTAAEQFTHAQGGFNR